MKIEVAPSLSDSVRRGITRLERLLPYSTGLVMMHPFPLSSLELIKGREWAERHRLISVCLG